MYIKIFLLFIFIHLTSISTDEWRVPSKYQTFEYETYSNEMKEIIKQINEKAQEVDRLASEGNISPMYWSYEKKALYLKLVKEVTDLENESNTLLSKHNAMQFLIEK